jgi:hypothetical protein
MHPAQQALPNLFVAGLTATIMFGILLLDILYPRHGV